MTLSVTAPLDLKLSSGKMSDEEFLVFCANNPKLRIEQDQYQNVIVMPPLKGDSTIYEKHAIVEVGIWEKINGGVSTSSAGGFKLPNGATRCPDACWISNERWATLSIKQKTEFLPIVPDFVMEIRSQSDSLTKLKAKMQEWIENGVRLGWLIDPKNKVTYIYRENGSIEIVEGFDKTLSGEEVMPEFEFDLGLFQIPGLKE